MNSVRVNRGRVRLNPSRVGLRRGVGWLGWDARVIKKMGKPAGPVRGGVGFRPKIEKRIGKLFYFQIFI
jgi:hypothetical protein